MISLGQTVRNCSLFVAIFLSLVVPSAAQSAQQLCDQKAHELLGEYATAIASGSFLHENETICVAALPLIPRTEPSYTRVREGVVLRRARGEWQKLLWFKNEIKNDQGYIGLDYIDPDESHTRGFAVTFSDHRSDGTSGFTMYFTYLDAKGQLQGLPIEVGWNPKVDRFQEYAPNELDPPDFKPELANPPTRKLR